MQVQFRTEPHLITSFRPVRGVSFISPLARERSESKGMQGKRIITWWVSGFPFISYGSDRWIQRRPVVTLTPYHPFIVKNETEKEKQQQHPFVIIIMIIIIQKGIDFGHFLFVLFFPTVSFLVSILYTCTSNGSPKMLGGFEYGLASSWVIRLYGICSLNRRPLWRSKNSFPNLDSQGFLFVFPWSSGRKHLGFLYFGHNWLGYNKSRPYGTMRTSCVSRQIGKVDSFIRFFKLSYVCIRPTDSSTC